MTEKHYGGSSSHGFKGNQLTGSSKELKIDMGKDNSKIKDLEFSISKEDIKTLKKAGEIAVKAKEYARSIIKKDTNLLEIAELTENKIIELGGKPAFPVTLSINEIAAHATPSFNDTSVAFGLLKVDLGVHIDGLVADTAFSIDLENNKENKALIDAAELALKKASDEIKLGTKLKTIGSIIETQIKSLGFQPIVNLSGHSIDQYDLHSGLTIPNYDNSQDLEVPSGLYAIEPFATTGLGSVRDGKPSGIYNLQKPGNVRDNFAREVLHFIAEEYQTLPFCSRWIYKKFGSRGLLALRQIESQGLLHQYPQLIETGKGKVAQAEHTIIINDKEKIITTI